MRQVIKNLLFPLLFLLIVILFFLPFLSGDKIMYVGDFTGSDLTELNLPFRYLAAESFKSGEVPFLTNLLAGGFPLLSEGQAGVFYPFNLILFILLPFVWAVNLTLLLNFYLAGIFTYLYSRAVKLSQVASLLAALTFSFSGFFIFRLKHLNLINAAIWLPLQFYLVEKYFSSKRKNLVLLLLSVVFVIQFFAGHPQISYISAMSSFMYFCFRFFNDKIVTVKLVVTKIFLPWLLVGILALGLSAIQLLPTIHYSLLSYRGLKMGYDQIVAFAYYLPSLFSFVFPYSLGNPALGTYPLHVQRFSIFWENNIYFGVLPFILAIFGFIFIAAKNKIAKTLAVLAAVSFLFILGAQSPLFVLFWELIPGFKIFRFPQRFLLLTIFALTILSAFSFDYFIEKLKNLSSKYKRVAKSKILLTYLLPLFVIVLVSLDLFIVNLNYIGVLDFNKYFSPPKSAEIIQEDKDIFRIHSLNWPNSWNTVYRIAGGWQNNMTLFIDERELIPPNLNVFWNISSIQDRASFEGGLLNQEVHNLSNLFINNAWETKNEEGELIINDPLLKIMGIQNVKYLLSYDPVSSDNLVITNEVKKDFLPPLKIYENKFYQPFVYGVFDVKLSQDSKEDFDLMLNEDFNPATQVILRQSSNDFDLKNQATSSVKLLSMSDRELSINANFSDDGYLYISQAFIPGWQAYIDGEEVEILRANHAFTALEVTGGNHHILLKFEPPLYTLGKWISFVFLLIFLILLTTFYFFYGRAKTFK